jgi:hypothetical protein
VRKRLAIAAALLAAGAAGAAPGPAAAVPVTQLGGASPAPARSPLAFVIQDDPRLLGHLATLDADLAEAQSLGFTHVRVTAHWNQLTQDPDQTRRPDFNAADPAAYPRDAWAGLDRLVRAADAHGLEVMIDIGFFAPRWATHGSPRSDPRPRNLIDPIAFRDFALAVVRRYGGGFRPSANSAPLPRVSLFELYNEVNLPVFWTPQRAVARHGRVTLVAPRAYRRLVEVTYPAIKSVRPDATVLVGDLAAGPPWFPRARRAGVPALRFLRELACVDSALRPLHTAQCRGFHPLLGDGFAVHPYALSGSPARRPTGNRVDTLTMGNIDQLAGLLRALAERGRIAPALQDIYVTEFGYLTRRVEPDAAPLRTPFPTVSPQYQAAWELVAHQLAWNQPQVRMFAHFLIRDTICTSGGDPFCIDWSSGYRSARGTPKPLFDALHAGLLTSPLPDGGTAVWARLGSTPARNSGTLEWRRADGPWHEVEPGDVRTYSADGPDGIVSLTLWPLDADEYRLDTGE